MDLEGIMLIRVSQTQTNAILLGEGTDKRNACSQDPSQQAVRFWAALATASQVILDTVSYTPCRL